MTVRISAEYGATDGSAPERVEIEWDDDAKQPTTMDLASLVDALGRVSARYEIKVAES